MIDPRTDPSTLTAQRRARWRTYFESMLPGPDVELEAATEAAMRAVARGEAQQAIIAAGVQAAKAERLVRQRPAATSSARQRPHQTTPRRATPAAQAPPPPRRTAPSQHPTRQPAASSGQARADGARPVKIWPPDSAVVGALEKRTESMDGQFFQTWSFRLFRLEDGHRPVAPPIPVEIRGRSIIGQLAKGDVVRLPSGQHGRTRIVKTLHNLTTETNVEAKGRPFRRSRTLRRGVRLGWTIIGGILALAILAAILMAAYFALTGGGVGFPTLG